MARRGGFGRAANTIGRMAVNEGSLRFPRTEIPRRTSPHGGGGGCGRNNMRNYLRGGGRGRRGRRM